MKLFKPSVRGCTPPQAMAFMHKYVQEGMNFVAEFDESIASTSELEELEHLKGERARFVEDFLVTGRQALHELDDIMRTIDLPRDGLAPEFRRQWGDTIRSFHSMFDLGEVMLSRNGAAREIMLSGQGRKIEAAIPVPGLPRSGRLN
jgi:hypothetical protein